jgi:hypothetical protein
MVLGCYQTAILHSAGGATLRMLLIKYCFGSTFFEKVVFEKVA